MQMNSVFFGGLMFQTGFVVNSITIPNLSIHSEVKKNSSDDTFYEENMLNETSGVNTSIMGVNDASGMMELPWYGYAICITTMLFIWVVGSAGNFLVIYLVCKEKQLQTPMNMFLVNLSIADFLTSAFGSPFPLIASITHRWPFGETMCTVYAFGMSVGGITSITTLMALAFERYLMIARPFRAADIRMYHSSAIIVFIWAYSLALTLPPLFGWASYGPEGPYLSCSVSWEKDDLATKTYICFLFILGLVIPLITITLSYIGIVTTIKSSSQAQTCARTATGRAELRVTAMVAAMIFCFLLAWGPYAIVSLIVSFGGPNEKKLITPVVSVLPAIFAKSATCYNPVIYVGLNTQFQNAWMKLFGIQREETDPQTGLTASVAGTVSTVPVIAKTEALNTSTPADTHLLPVENMSEKITCSTPADTHLLPVENMSKKITCSSNPLQEDVTHATAAALTNPITKSNEVNSVTADATALELHTIVLHPTGDDDRQCEKIPPNNDVIQA